MDVASQDLIKKAQRVRTEMVGPIKTAQHLRDVMEVHRRDFEAIMQEKRAEIEAEMPCWRQLQQRRQESEHN